MKIALIGDIALNGLFSTDPNSNSERFKEISNLLKDADLIIGNLEIPIYSEYDKNDLKQDNPLISSSESTASIIRELGITHLSIANNHFHDNSSSFVSSTVELIKDLKIPFTGAGNQPSHVQPLIIDTPKGKIGLISYVDLSTNPSLPLSDEYYLNILDTQKVLEDIKKLKPLVNKLILSLHWGNDYSHYPQKQQQEMARLFIDSGVDVILGHHPHTIQPYELYKDGIIFYSLGQLCFGDFLSHGKMKSLRIKTKRSFIPILNEEMKITSIIPLKEKKGNYIVVTKRNIENWSRRLLRNTRLKNHFAIVNASVVFKEAFYDRIYNYFFGYYRNPFRDINKSLFQNKLKYLLNDIRKYGKR